MVSACSLLMFRFVWVVAFGLILVTSAVGFVCCLLGCLVWVDLLVVCLYNLCLRFVWCLVSLRGCYSLFICCLLGSGFGAVGLVCGCVFCCLLRFCCSFVFCFCLDGVCLVFWYLVALVCVLCLWVFGFDLCLM